MSPCRSCQEPSMLHRTAGPPRHWKSTDVRLCVRQYDLGRLVEAQHGILPR